MFAMMSKANKALSKQSAEERLKNGCSAELKKNSRIRLENGDVRQSPLVNNNNVLAYAEAVRLMGENPALNRRQATIRACAKIKGSRVSTVYTGHRGLHIRAERQNLITATNG